MTMSGFVYSLSVLLQHGLAGCEMIFTGDKFDMKENFYELMGQQALTGRNVFFNK
jgi:hypothetical protein